MRQMVWSAVLLLIFVLSPQMVEAGTTESGSYGGKNYKLYHPDSVQDSGDVPLVVMLHGCTQDANQFAAGTQMNAVADREGFYVLYPEQSAAADMQKCWKWFEAAHQARGRGEPATLAGLVQQVINQKEVDREKVYVTGLSAGGAMAGIMGATYPDLFSGIGVASGLEYKAGTTQLEGIMAMSNGGPDPARQGQLAFQAMGSHAEVVPTIVFHGTADYTVNVINGNQVLSQWAKTNDLVLGGRSLLTDQADEKMNQQVPGGRSYSEELYRHGETKELLLKKVLVNGMGHAWSGGSTAGSYTDPSGPNASEMMWAFFSDLGEDDNEQPDRPTVVANPAGGVFREPVTVAVSSETAKEIRCQTDGREATSASPLYTEPFLFEKTTTLSCIGVTDEGTAGTILKEVYQIQDDGDPIEEIVIQVEAANSGFVGRLAADGIGSQLKAGDKGMFNTDTFRSILSFSTADVSQASNAMLRVPISEVEGNVSGLVLDAKNNYFGNSMQLERADFAAPGDYVAISQATVKNGDSYVEFTLPANVVQALTNQKAMQFRIRATSTASFQANVVHFKQDNEGATLRIK
ncbi:PHB depolymerase family esterase [Shouchella sp. JSM 1781072]|uniref:extracellular catalytic domain type 1 short-chain-length polyhydroxyalkanoate depolymerase n=1 Tax=Bacillaceae TaxID=186817 RepID=UPI0020D1921C|nr:PHB depolymerase family esterase [Alkalihalobacillus sp. LMS6]UTR06772.1 PHB depolymerase family esterase [Alkalihalobacillus sp. LMS6]